MINIVNSIVGFIFINRTMLHFLNEEKFPKKFLKSFFNFLILLNTFITFFISLIPPWVFSSYLILQILFLFHSEKLFNLIMKQKFDQQLLRFIDESILIITTGRSFRESIQIFCRQEQTFFSKKILEIYQSAIHDNKIQNWMNEPKFLALWQLFISLEQSSHKNLDKLRAFRRQIFWEQNFKQKSSRATLQVKAQATTLSILYIGLLSFVWMTSKDHNLNWILLSLILYCTGLLSLFILGRRKKWKT